MPIITYRGASYQSLAGETVTECLERHGVSVTTSCRSGVCQSCMMRAVAGQPTHESCKDLKPALRDQRYFLPCVCRPDADLTIESPGAAARHQIAATLVLKERLSEHIIRIRLKPHKPFEFRPGQFINVCRPHDELVRSYSLASLPQYNEQLEIHVRRLQDGAMSTWLHDYALPGERLLIEGPHGECFYLPGAPQQTLLLIGTGCGLSPLYGIVRDALDHGHGGAIHLFHGSSRHDGLYLVDELRQLAAVHANFLYTPCVSSEPARPGYISGRAEQVALDTIRAMKGIRIYLCGHPDMIKDTKRKAFLAGASLMDIHADPFIISHPAPQTSPRTFAV